MTGRATTPSRCCSTSGGLVTARAAPAVRGGLRQLKSVADALMPSSGRTLPGRARSAYGSGGARTWTPSSFRGNRRAIPVESLNHSAPTSGVSIKWPSRRVVNAAASSAVVPVGSNRPLSMKGPPSQTWRGSSHAIEEPGPRRSPPAVVRARVGCGGDCDAGGVWRRRRPRRPGLTAERLQFQTQPGSATAGAPLGPLVQIAVLDGAGNVMTGSSALVRLVLDRRTAGGGTPSASWTMETAAPIATHRVRWSVGSSTPPSASVRVSRAP